jgi:hypothetical protein
MVETAPPDPAKSLEDGFYLVHARMGGTTELKLLAFDSVANLF